VWRSAQRAVGRLILRHGVLAAVCTLVFAWQVFDPYLVVAANRDEQLDRPSEPPAVRDWEPDVLAPVDEDAGGTWIGYNEHGVFVAITNRWVDGSFGGERSRGLLVRDALRSDTAEDAARFVERAVREDEYSGFNLVVADENAALYFEWDGQLAVSNLQPGVHVVVNVGADGDYRIPGVCGDDAEQQAQNADRLRELLTPEPGEDDGSWLDRAGTAISDHEYGVCVHGETPEGSSDDSSGRRSAGGFGTRSSSLVVLGEDERSYQYADGPPCRTTYRTVESQV
jgi:hypothetical protein